MSLKINNISAKLPILDKLVLKNLSLVVNPGETHVLMGPNGSGKSSLAKVLMGHSDYEVAAGSVSLDELDLTELEPDARSRAGLFLASQYPTEIPGVNLANFLRLSYNAHQSENERLSVFKFRKLLRELLPQVGLSDDFMNRNLNEGFSGGEKKKCEILQLLLLKPKYAILDETDSGLDVDAIRTIFKTLENIISSRRDMGVILITHYPRIFEFIKPDFVHIFKDGQVTQTGGLELAMSIDKHGYGI